MTSRILPAAAGLALAVAVFPALATAAGPGPAARLIPTPVTQTFSSSAIQQTFAVPAGVTSIHVKAVGGPGADGADATGFANGGNGGKAAVVEGDVTVTPGATLYVMVGGAGSGTSGGYNGGGAGTQGHPQFPYTASGGGGGATDIRTLTCGVNNYSCYVSQTPQSVTSRLLVAAGGGGGGSPSYGPGAVNGNGAGGNGGAAGGIPNGSGGAGADGQTIDPSGAGGGGGGAPGTPVINGPAGGSGSSDQGTQTPATAGNSYVGGSGGGTQSAGQTNGGNAGGGGGGGYLGGGGGGSGGQSSSNQQGGGGGGGAGSSWSDPTAVTNATISTDNTGIPLLVISYVPPASPSPSPSASPTPSASPAPEPQTPADLSLKIGGQDAPVDANGRTPVAAGQEFTVEGTGLLPGSTVTVEVRSAPIVLAKPTVAPNGSFSTVVTLPASLADGVHTLVATGVDVNGDPVVAEIPLIVGDSLPTTGSPVAPMFGIGLAALLLGIVAIVAVRRRRSA